jgi:hypothetical protein
MQHKAENKPGEKLEKYIIIISASLLICHLGQLISKFL